MCDRCSLSRFHALHLNNSPCTVNPWTLDHLHGTPGPRKFRLLPSVCLCASTPSSHRGAPGNYSAEQACFFFIARSTRFFFSVKGEASSPKRERWDYPLTRHKWQRPQPRHLAADFLPAGPLRRPGIAASSVGHGALAAEASSVQTAAASGWKCWHLPTPFLYPPPPLPPQPFPVLPPPSGDEAHPSKAETARLNSCPPAAACHLMFSQ